MSDKASGRPKYHPFPGRSNRLPPHCQDFAKLPTTTLAVNSAGARFRLEKSVFVTAARAVRSAILSGFRRRIGNSLVSGLRRPDTWRETALRRRTSVFTIISETWHMRKLIAMAALTVGIGSLALSEVPFADAQEKKDVKKDTKKDVKKADPKKVEVKKDKEEMGVGTIEIYKAKDGFRFRIKDEDRKVAAMPVKGLETEAEVKEALEAIKATLNKVKPTVVKD